jgi:hypothetical protein
VRNTGAGEEPQHRHHTKPKQYSVEGELHLTMSCLLHTQGSLDDSARGKMPDLSKPFELVVVDASQLAPAIGAV